MKQNNSNLKYKSGYRNAIIFCLWTGDFPHCRASHRVYQKENQLDLLARYNVVHNGSAKIIYTNYLHILDFQWAGEKKRKNVFCTTKTSLHVFLAFFVKSCLFSGHCYCCLGISKTYWSLISPDIPDMISLPWEKKKKWEKINFLLVELIIFSLYSFLQLQFLLGCILVK